MPPLLAAVEFAAGSVDVGSGEPVFRTLGVGRRLGRQGRRMTVLAAAPDVKRGEYQSS